MRVRSFAGPIAALAVVAGCGSSGAAHHQRPRIPQRIAASAGATTCVDSGYQLVGRPIYDCQFATGPDKCVTYEGGIADDATEEARFFFSTAHHKPTCLSGLRPEGSRG
ncbi:MAG TPA: hypothetical protein VFM43_03015 [Gaiellaceae bacterium]|nr:hypothetical protein [Gaiellaceae bacterium]